MEETEGDGRWTDNKLGQVGNRERCFSLEEIRNGIYWNHTRARCFDVASSPYLWIAGLFYIEPVNNPYRRFHYDTENDFGIPEDGLGKSSST